MSPCAGHLCPHQEIKHCTHPITNSSPTLGTSSSSPPSRLCASPLSSLLSPCLLLFLPYPHPGNIPLSTHVPRNFYLNTRARISQLSSTKLCIAVDGNKQRKHSWGRFRDLDARVFSHERDLCITCLLPRLRGLFSRADRKILRARGNGQCKKAVFSRYGWAVAK